MLWLVWLLPGALAAVLRILPPSFIPQPIDPVVYGNLKTYAHLTDIAYCVDKFHKIEEPFACDLQCSDRFPNVTLVHQWYLDDSVAGYIASTYTNIFNYNEPTGGKKTVIVSLRGTRSIYDTVADLKVPMAPYSNLRYRLPYCGPNCRIHGGFAEYFRNTLRAIHDLVERQLLEENYELVLVGHSLGGSVALLLALHYLDLGYNKLTLVTMGQPLVGNKDFTTWADYVLGSAYPVVHNTYDRKYFRVVHKGDIVTTVPRQGLFFERYYPFENQIYLNASASCTVPAVEQVVDCFSGDNPACIAGDFPGDVLLDNYYENHNTYFRHMGLCGIHV